MLHNERHPFHYHSSFFLICHLSLFIHQTNSYKNTAMVVRITLIRIPMVITNLEQKENRKIWVPIRDGNRGGWSLFEWEKVRDMPYRDREMYLGNSAKLGVLDKGGKWRKKDWYLKRNHLEGDQLELRRIEAMKRDQERFNAALGITAEEEDDKLTPAEMQVMLARIKGKKEDNGFVENDGAAIGLGFDKTKVEIRAKPSAKVDNPHRLEGTVEEWVKMEARESDEEGIRMKKQHKQKKEKKEKKEKKGKQGKKEKKEKHRHRERSKSRSQRRKSQEEDSEKEHKMRKKIRHRSSSRSPSMEKRRERGRSPSHSPDRDYRRHKEDRYDRSRDQRHSKKHRYDSD